MKTDGFEVSFQMDTIIKKECVSIKNPLGKRENCIGEKQHGRNAETSESQSSFKQLDPKSSSHSPDGIYI